MTKMNNTIREMIADNAMRAQFGPTEKLLEQLENVLARECYDHFYAADLALIAKLSKGWFDTNDYLNIRCGYEMMCLRSKNEIFILPSNYEYRQKIQILRSDSDLACRICEHARAKEDFKAKKKTANLALKSMLSKILTLKHLIDAWPEGKLFYQWLLDNPPENKAALPAVHVTTINEMLGIK